MDITRASFRKLVILPVRAYQLLVSPLFPSSCRHVPSCSQYMIEAVDRWGAAKGLVLGVKRLARCHPWGTSGYDPVPEKVSAGANEGKPAGTRAEMLEETDQLLLQFGKRGGLLPVVIQESRSGQILMQASVNREAVEYTLQHGKAAFWSTSRNELWVKGASSGNTLSVNRILVDCDQDALIYQVTLDKGGVCHTIGRDHKNRKACFYRSYDPDTDRLSFISGME